MHTLKDAKKLMCPQVPGEGTFTCRGDKCMAWRWAIKKNPDYRPSGMSFYPHGEPPSHIEDREHGYCGLAGRP